MNSIIQDSWLRCADHQDTYQFILLSKKSEQNRLKCSQCLFSKDALAYKEEFQETFPLQLALKSPQLMVNFLKKDNDGQYIKDIFEKCELDMEQEFNEQIKKFEILIKIFDQMKEEIKQRLQSYLSTHEKIKRDFSRSIMSSNIQKCNFNLLQNLIFQLKELEKQAKSDQYTSILTKINATLDEMFKDNCYLFSSTIQELQINHNQMKINQKLSNHDQCQHQITQLFTQYGKFIADLDKDLYHNVLQTPEFILLNNDYFKKLYRKIEVGSNYKIKSINLVYLGTRDGLNGKAFWGKINGKSNLLIVLKQQNNQIFGGYTPCIWEGSGMFKSDDSRN